MRIFVAKRKIIITAIVLLVIITQIGCHSHAAPVEKEDYYLDTVCKISVYEIKGKYDVNKANKAIDAAFAECRRLDKILSATASKSDISKINDAGGVWVKAQDDTLNVIKSGIKYGKLSGGAFDITVGTVTDLWDYHAEKPKLPKKNKVEEAVAHVDYTKIKIDGKRVRLVDPAAKLDLGGIAKGYIADRMTQVLEKSGVTSAIINLGGNIVAIGGKPGGGKFKIGIEKPYSGRSEIIGVTKVKNRTVVTSGVYERQFKINGKVYHHILSTRNGYPVETDLDAVSLVGLKGSSMDIDALSTICLIKGSEEGKKFIEKIDDVEAVFCEKDGNNTKTKGMKVKFE